MLLYVFAEMKIPSKLYKTVYFLIKKYYNKKRYEKKEFCYGKETLLHYDGDCIYVG